LGIVPNGINVIWLINIADRLKTLEGSFGNGKRSGFKSCGRGEAPKPPTNSYPFERSCQWAGYGQTSHPKPDGQPLLWIIGYRVSSVGGASLDRLKSYIEIQQKPSPKNRSLDLVFYKSIKEVKERTRIPRIN